LNILSIEDCAYIAGIFDGEGTAQIQTHKGKCRLGYNISPRIQIPNNNKDLIDWIHNKLPEFTLWTRSPRKITHAISYVLVISRVNDIIEFINQILPYLIVKRKQCELILQYCYMRLEKRKINNKAPLGDDEIEMYKKMKILNKRGE